MNISSKHKTIASIVTPLGEGGIGKIIVSGKDLTFDIKLVQVTAIGQCFGRTNAKMTKTQTKGIWVKI